MLHVRSELRPRLQKSSCCTCRGAYGSWSPATTRHGTWTRAGSQLLNWYKCFQVALIGSDNNAASAKRRAGSGGMVPANTESKKISGRYEAKRPQHTFDSKIFNGVVKLIAYSGSIGRTRSIQWLTWISDQGIVNTTIENHF